MKKNIGIAYGGYSSEYEISIKSGEFIFDILNKNPEWNIYKILVSKKKNLSELQRQSKRRKSSQNENPGYG